MKPLVTFPDPEAAVIGRLTTAFASRLEPYRPAVIDTYFPETTLVNATRLQVALEVGGTQDYPVTERAQVRVTAHVPPSRGAGDTVGGRSDVKRLASLAQGLLCSWTGDAGVAGVVPLIGRSDVIKDDATNNLMVWFTVRVDLKATLLVS